MQQALDVAEFGGKAFHLGAALRAGLPVPPGYAVSVDALHAIDDQDAAALDRIHDIVARLGPPIAARSSAIGEDAEQASFAGQHVTALNLMTPQQSIEGLRRVYESAHTDAALSYRRKKGITAPIRVAAVIQKLVDPICAGVLFTKNPVTGAREHVIEAAWGLGETVVAGLVTPDHYRVALDGRILERRAGDKDLAVRRDPNGSTQEVEIEPHLVHARCLDDAWLARLSDLASRCESHFGPDLDLEWARVGDDLYLLQSRPISTGRS